MTSREKLIAPIGFMLAGVLFLFAAAGPALRGGKMNVAFLPLGIVFLVLGFAALNRARRA
jgi:hypothetical protein